jgi:hypothetical protein
MSMSTQFFSVENYQSSGRSLEWGIPGEPYSRHNYIDLIEECKTKDKELTALRKIVNGAKYEQMRRDMEDKALQGDPRMRRRHEQELRVGPLASKAEWQLGPPRFLLSGYSPPSTIGLDIQSLCMPVAWPKRAVVVVSFDIPTQIYRVSTSDATFTLVGAADYLEGERSLGLEIELEAFCDLVYSGNDAKPSLQLRYRNHCIHHEQDQTVVLRQVSGRVSVLFHRRRANTVQIWMVRELHDDYVDWKYVLKAYLTAVTTFPQFAPDKDRARIRRTINTMRDQLLDASRWNLPAWHYDRLMCVYEGQGWSLNDQPFTVLDGEMLMNLSQEAQKAMGMMVKMARFEIEQRIEGFDTPKRKRLRERWTIPFESVDAPRRPYEVMKQNVLNVHMENVSHACERVLQKYVGEVPTSLCEKERVTMTSYNDIAKRKQASQVYLVQWIERDCDPSLQTAETYVEGRWFDADKVLTSVGANGPFRKLLEVATTSDWRRIHVQLRDWRSTRLNRSSNAALTPSRTQKSSNKNKGVAVQHTTCTPATLKRESKPKNRKITADNFQYDPIPDTPVQQLRIPKGGWLYSEMKRRVGPGTNDPKIPRSVKEQTKIKMAKAKRKRERKKALRRRKRDSAAALRRSQSMDDSCFLPKL